MTTPTTPLTPAAVQETSRPDHDTTRTVALRTLTAITAATLLLILAGGPAAAASGRHASMDSDRITAWVEERMAVHRILGAAVAVVRDGQLQHLAGYGTADEDGRPVTPDTPFIIGSVSKPFTAVVVGQLVDE